jgi:hypothetical protein
MCKRFRTHVVRFLFRSCPSCTLDLGEFSVNCWLFGIRPGVISTLCSSLAVHSGEDTMEGVETKDVDSDERDAEIERSLRVMYTHLVERRRHLRQVGCSSSHYIDYSQLVRFLADMARNVSLELCKD